MMTVPPERRLGLDSCRKTIRRPRTNLLTYHLPTIRRDPATAVETALRAR